MTPHAKKNATSKKCARRGEERVVARHRDRRARLPERDYAYSDTSITYAAHRREWTMTYLRAAGCRGVRLREKNGKRYYQHDEAEQLK